MVFYALLAREEARRKDLEGSSGNKAGEKAVGKTVVIYPTSLGNLDSFIPDQIGEVSPFPGMDYGAC